MAGHSKWANIQHRKGRQDAKRGKIFTKLVLEGVNYEEIRYEGYGISGVAIIIDCLTDNKVRAVADVRHALSKNGGNYFRGFR